MISRLARWWLVHVERRRLRREVPAAPSLSGECICGREVRGDDLHLVVALSDDDARIGIEGGGRTAVSADFCPEHCPGGCLRGCVPSTT